MFENLTKWGVQSSDKVGFTKGKGIIQFNTDTEILEHNKANGIWDPSSVCSQP
jgi:hypothetical protein